MAKKSKFTDAQIIAYVKEVEGGAAVAEVSRRAGVAINTLQRWRAKFGGLEVSEAQEKRRLEEENRRLKQIVADLSLDNQALKAALGKKW